MNNLVPNWKYLNQVEGEDKKRSSHVFKGNHEVTELTWENGQLGLHEISGPLPYKPTWNRSSDTLESIVHQATSSQNNTNPEMSLPHNSDQFDPANTSSNFSFSFEKSIDNPKFRDFESGIAKKRIRLEPDQSYENHESSFQGGLESGSIGGSAPLSRENDIPTTMMTWPSLEENPPNLKAKTKDDDSAFQEGSENMDQEEQRRTKGETSRSNPMRRNRATANHNQSERRRRDRINQKMKALQRLVPNASKNDKASMLDEVIAYLKQLQAQVKMMNARTIPQMIPALAMQQQMQMALLARMGMGVALGMGPTGHSAGQTLPQIVSQSQIANSPLFSPQFVMPQLIPNSNANGINNSASFNNPYSSFFPQPMNMDLYNKMAAIYQQQMNQTNQPTTNPSPHNNVQGG